MRFFLIAVELVDDFSLAHHPIEFIERYNWSRDRIALQAAKLAYDRVLADVPIVTGKGHYVLTSWAVVFI